MIHAPCSDNPDSICMRKWRISKNFSKLFRTEIVSIEGNKYVSYRNRSPEEGSEFELWTKKSNALGIGKMAIDNSWLVLYSPDFLRKFRTRMNVELCIPIVISIKYLFNYVCKGSDRVTVEIGRAPTDGQKESISKGVHTIDEVRHYQDARYVSASQAAWRLFSFPSV